MRILFVIILCCLVTRVLADYVNLGGSDYTVSDTSCPLGQIYDFTQSASSDILSQLQTFNSSFNKNTSDSTLVNIMDKVLVDLDSLSNMYVVQSNSSTLEINYSRIVLIISLVYVLVNY